MLHVIWRANDHRYPFFQNFLCLEGNKRNKLTFYLLTRWPNYLPTYSLILKTVKGFYPDNHTQPTYVTYTYYLLTYLRNRNNMAPVSDI